uniref:Chemokine interleukin-8-like domain-containing protein n=1 Tax=Electrophorus electricus TaxID=8005 RepID=A0A4W4HKU6_ELEEL
MKTYCTVVIALLLFAFCSQTLTETSHEPNKCCFSYFKSRIPELFVRSSKLEICANPTQLWVQKLMNVIKTRMQSVPVTTASSGDITP